MDDIYQLNHGAAQAVRTMTWLRDEEAAGSNPATPTQVVMLFEHSHSLQSSTVSARAVRLMPCLRRPSYAFDMSDSPLSRQEIYAAAAAHDELGPEYSDAVVASFLEKVDKEIDARVDARLAGRRQPAPPAERDYLRTLLKGAAVGIGASGIAFFVVGGNADERLHRGIWVLLLLVAICAAAAGWAGRRLSNRPAAIPRPGRPAE
jgi:hypothetical protein